MARGRTPKTKSKTPQPKKTAVDNKSSLSASVPVSRKRSAAQLKQEDNEDEMPLKIPLKAEVKQQINAFNRALAEIHGNDDDGNDEDDDEAVDEKDLDSDDLLKDDDDEDKEEKADDKTNGKEQRLSGKEEESSDSGTKTAPYTDEQTLFLKNLPLETTVEDITSLSNKILEVRLRITVSGKKSYAYVVFPSEVEAEKHYRFFQTKQLLEVPLQVDYVGSKSSRPQKVKSKGDELRNLKRLYVTGLGRLCTEKKLHKMFPEAVHCKVTRNRLGHAIGFGFVTFRDEKTCAENLQPFRNGKNVDGHIIVASYAKAQTNGSNPGHADTDFTQENVTHDKLKLYVSGLNPATTQLDLLKAFPAAGNAVILHAKKDRPSFGFVHFSLEKHAAAALRKAQNLTICDRIIRAEYAKKTDDSKRGQE